MEFRDFGHATTIPICNWIFETFWMDGKFKGLSNKPSNALFAQVMMFSFSFLK
jgi:hypothetical protein